MNGTAAPTTPRVTARQVAERLRELRGWASYIADALRHDQEWEPGRLEAMEQLTGPGILGDARELATALDRSLRELLRRAEGPALSEPEEEWRPAERD